MNAKLALAAALALITTIVGTAILGHLKVRKQEQAKRSDIDIQLELDLQAIRLAGERISEKLKDQSVPMLYTWQIEKLFQEELAFQKIAVRVK